MKQKEIKYEVSLKHLRSEEMEAKIINKSKDELQAKRLRKSTAQKYLNKILHRNSSHHAVHKYHNEVCHLLKLQNIQKINKFPHQQTSRDSAYVLSGIYQRFGNSCLESLKQQEQVKREVKVEDLSSTRWYQNVINRSISVDLLERQPSGSFIIQKACLKSGNFILSLRVSSASKKVIHYLIVQSKKGYRFKNSKKVFSTLTSLVTHHAVMKEQLPVALLLEKTYEMRKNFTKGDDFCCLEDLGTVFTSLAL